MGRRSEVSNSTWASVAALLLGALTVMFGLQLMRMLFVGMAVYLTQIQDISSILVGVMGLAVFLCGLLEPLVRRVLGFRNALPIVVGSLSLVWLAEKLILSLPVDLGLSIAGTVLFLWSLPPPVSVAPNAGRPRQRRSCRDRLLGGHFCRYRGQGHLRHHRPLLGARSCGIQRRFWFGCRPRVPSVAIRIA